ncbi:MAG TPA: cytochrome c [Sunxiuqinia sp.]|nr:cytochrome c [Sunxiuqinia sp.]
MNLKKGTKILIAIAVGVALSACDHGRNNPGYEYFDDMVQSEAYESYTPNPNFKDGKTMQGTVEGTVPRNMIPYPYTKSDADRKIAGETLTNPLTATSVNIARGQAMFDTYCINCHGPKGDGQGNLFTSKKYPYPPANLLSDKIRNSPDGEIYHVITVGWGVMGAHGSMINPDDRWKIVLYIKNVLHKN